ncbi:MAG TPA: regulatory iron-sulfur-containing complex subunit RicT, partial [Parasegetibacter sp.]
MGCSSCGTGTGKPNGCKSNGGCSTGGCNRMNVHDWLANLPFSDPETACRVVEVSFNHGSRKDFFRNPTLQQFEKGDMVAVEGVSGFDVGEVTLTGELVRLQLKKRGINEHDPEMKKILRKAGERDMELFAQNKAREKNALIRSRAIARQYNLEMKLAEVEIQADGRKATFFYTADDRVDFRELIKTYAAEFKVKVEMRQIGSRQEAGKVGGIGSCGRELCCSTWLTDFKSVNTTAARYQNLSINQTKLSGQCGRLKCCLNYELDTYLDALQAFPDNADQLRVAKGTAFLIKRDIFKNLMWYTLPDSTKQYPLTIERVKKIMQLNAQGQIPDELEAVELQVQKPRELESEFVDVVGQISLKTLEKADKKKKTQHSQSKHQHNKSQQSKPDQRGGSRFSDNRSNKGGQTGNQPPR